MSQPSEKDKVKIFSASRRMFHPPSKKPPPGWAKRGMRGRKRRAAEEGFGQNEEAGWVSQCGRCAAKRSYWTLVTFRLVGGAGLAEAGPALKAIAIEFSHDELLACVQVKAKGDVLL
jgi:hypothetical protein